MIVEIFFLFWGEVNPSSLVLQRKSDGCETLLINNELSNNIPFVQSLFIGEHEIRTQERDGTQIDTFHINPLAGYYATPSSIDINDGEQGRVEICPFLVS